MNFREKKNTHSKGIWLLLRRLPRSFVDLYYVDKTNVKMVVK